MAKAKQPYERPVKKDSPELPEYKKEYNQLHSIVKIGNIVQVDIRKMDGCWKLATVEGVVEKININSMKLSGRDFAIPWYTIHDWEILE
jgi:hypothetical protein